MVSLGSTLVVMLAALGAATCRPGWYRPAAIDYARLDDDKRDLVNQLDAIGGALNSRRSIVVTLREDQANRWIAARRELWSPEAVVPLEPLENPVIDFIPGGRFRIGAVVRSRGVGAVVSWTGRVELRDGRIVVDSERLASGVLPLPAGGLSSIFRNLVNESGGALRVAADGTVELRNEWRWPNGKPRFRVVRVETDDDSAAIELAPL
jgi:hypothetical protein